jgi:TatA/E family protein of Tat protein translocase
MGIDSPIHLLFLGAVALIVLGPKRLPELARALGKGIREFRTAFDEAAAPQAGAAPVAAPQSGPAPAPQAAPAPAAAPQTVATPVLEPEHTTEQLAAGPIPSPAVAQQTAAQQAGAEQAGPVPQAPPETGPERPS